MAPAETLCQPQRCCGPRRLRGPAVAQHQPDFLCSSVISGPPPGVHHRSAPAEPRAGTVTGPTEPQPPQVGKERLGLPAAARAASPCCGPATAGKAAPYLIRENPVCDLHRLFQSCVCYSLILVTCSGLGLVSNGGISSCERTVTACLFVNRPSY